MEITLSQAIDGFLLDCEARQLSPHTIANYCRSFRKLQTHLGDDPPLRAITVDQVRHFLADLGTRPQPRDGVAERAPKPLSKKSVHNVHAGLSALWTWAVAEDVVDRHILHEVPRPKPEKRVVNPLTLDDVRALFAFVSVASSQSYTRPGKRRSTHSRPTALRDRAIVLLLLDTGIRASELCQLTIPQVDLKNQRCRVFGKGSKERILPFLSRTTKAIWKYLATRSETNSDRLFVTRYRRDYSRQALLLLTRSLGVKEGINRCHPHRFRHTFAINFLRNGGDAYTLQMLLGHSTMEMVRKYL